MTMLEQQGYVKVEITKEQIEKLEAVFNKAKNLVDNFDIKDYIKYTKKRFLFFKYKKKAYAWSEVYNSIDEKLVRVYDSGFAEPNYRLTYTHDLIKVNDVLCLVKNGKTLYLSPYMSRVLTKYTT